MAVRRIKEKWYVDFRYERKRVRRISPEDTKKGAQAYELLLRQRAARGEEMFPLNIMENHTVSYDQFFKEWFDHYVLSNNSISEQKRKISIFENHLKPFFGKMDIRMISAQDVERFKGWALEKNITQKTLNNLLTVLRKSFSSAFEWEIITRIPLIRPVKAPEPKTNYLAVEEVESLLNVTGNLLNCTMVRMAVRTGMRLGELCGIRWEDIDLSSKIITVRRSFSQGLERNTKNYKIRYVPISEDLLEMLVQLDIKTGIVFPNRHSRSMEEWEARAVLTRHCKAAGIRRITWHVLRHTFATQLAQNGVPMFTIQQLMGHSTLRMTERYAHFGSKVHHDAVATLVASKNSQNENFGHQAGIEKSDKPALFESGRENLLDAAEKQHTVCLRK